MSDCCLRGFHWEGKPTGQETKISSLDVYVTGDPASQIAVLYCHDGFGWQMTNNRLLADHFAEEVGARVYIPDFYHGEAVPLDIVVEEWDWPDWLSRNSVENRWEEISAFAKHLRTQHAKIGAIGHCWGGKAALRLGGKAFGGSAPLADATVLAHPSFITKEELSQVGVPIQILSPEHDSQYTPELKAYSLEEIPKLGLEFDYQYFPGAVHGFATRCDKSKDKERKDLERAKNAAVLWFSSHLK